MDDLISRKAAIEEIEKTIKANQSIHYEMRYWEDGMGCALNIIEDIPSAEPEPLTDKEQRIFLAAMAREEKVCEEVDRNYTREPYEDSLVSICREIERKVKGALWGI